MKLFYILFLSLGYSILLKGQWSNGLGLEPNPPHTVHLNSSNQFRSVRIKDSSVSLGLAGKLQVQANVDNTAQISQRLVNFIGLNMSSSENVLRLEATLSNFSQNPYFIKGIADTGGANPPTNFYIRSSGSSSFNSTMNLLSINDNEHVALSTKSDEAIWYNDDYFSWGFGGNWNRFADGITIGSSTPPSNGTALRITSSQKIFLEGGDIELGGGDILVSTGDIQSSGGDHIFYGGNVIMNSGKIVYKSETSKKLSFENESNIEKSFIESGANFLRIGDLNQLFIELDNERYFTASKFYDANIFSKKVHFKPNLPINFGVNPDVPDASIQIENYDLFLSNVKSQGKVTILTNEGDVLIGNTQTNIVMQDGFVGINEATPQHSLHINGNVGITGEFFALSDERIKSNVYDIQNAEDALSKLRPVSYNFVKQQGDKALTFSTNGQYGLIAQEVEQVLPDLIVQHHSTGVINNEEVKLKGVNYNGLIAILIKGHQEQAEQIENYEKITDQLTIRLAKLENRLKNER